MQTRHFTARNAVAWLLAALALGGCASTAPQVDHHQHVVSPALAALWSSAGAAVPPIPASEVIELLDAAGIRSALLLSLGYSYGSPSRTLDDEYAKVRAENDWTAAQAAQYPARLLAFCGFNPLKDYALRELERCARPPLQARGIKLHFGNSDVQLDDPAHLQALQRVFAAANAQRMAIVVHLRASISRQRPYGAAQARLFLEQVVPLAPDVTIQIAHMAGSGPGYADPPAQEAMALFASAAERGDPQARRLWFDIASNVAASTSPVQAGQLARHIRQVGVDRVLYGTDAAIGDNLRPRAAWEAVMQRLPLTAQELAVIARNRAPYLPR